MTWLNYHHLHYFWVVAREGTIQNASQLLHVGQPAISTQLHQLEQSLGQKLFRRVADDWNSQMQDARFSDMPSRFFHSVAK